MKTLLIYLTPLLIFFGFCSRPQAKNEAPAINELPSNTEFQIILPEDHREGSTWQLDGSYNPTVIQRINEVWHGNEKGIYFNLRTLSAGQTTLNFTNRKYSDTADYKHFIIKVKP